MLQYLGYEEFHFNEQQMADFYSGIKVPRLFDNQYAIIMNEKDEVVDKLYYKNNKFVPIHWKPIDNLYHGMVKPRNLEQELAFDMLQRKNITTKILTGTYGSFKTGAMVVHALDEVMRGNYRKLIWVRNNFNVAGSNDVGYLAGTLQEKLWPWAGPLMDHCGGEYGLQTLINQDKIEIVHIGFLRGRSIDDSILLCSEAQNLTISMVALLLGRIGMNSQLWLEGDVHGQQDSKIFMKSRGVETAIDVLKGNSLFGYVHLRKTERSETAQLANLFEEYLT
mgnify:FL=1